MITNKKTAKKKASSRSPKHLRFSCLTFEQAGKTLILFVCSAKKLWSITEINKREEDKDKGYQRAVSPSRAGKIATFIDAENVIPNSVLVSFEHAKLSKDESELIVENRQDAGWVIDGQHRMAGGNESDDDILLPVVAFTDLDLKNQIKCFVTINKEQKGVPSSLYLELLSKLPGNRNPTDEAKERAVDLAHELKSDEESPFYGRIVSTTSPRKGELSMTQFVRKVHPMLKRGSGRLAIFSDEERCGIINNYYKGLGQAFSKQYEDIDSMFFKTLGFGAMMDVLPTFLDITLGECGGKFRVADTVKVLKRVSHFDFDSWAQMGTGSGAESQAADDLRTELLHYAKSTSGAGAIQL